MTLLSDERSTKEYSFPSPLSTSFTIRFLTSLCHTLVCSPGKFSGYGTPLEGVDLTLHAESVDVKNTFHVFLKFSIRVLNF